MSNRIFLRNADQGKNEWWRYLFTLIILLVGSIVGVIILGVAVTFISFSWRLITGQTQDLQGFLTERTLFTFAIEMSLWPVAFLITYLCIKFIHQRRFFSLVNSTNKFRFKLFFRSALLWFSIIIATQLVFIALNSTEYEVTFSPFPFVLSLALVLVFIPFQSGVEELLCRAYLPQGLLRIFRKQWIVIIISSLVFALLHVPNPEFTTYGFAIMFLDVFIVGLYLGLLSYVDDGLESAFGVHLANNLVGLLFIDFTRDTELNTILRVKNIYNVDVHLSLVVLAMWISIHLMFMHHRRIGQWVKLKLATKHGANN